MIPNGIEEIGCFAGSEVSTDVKQITAKPPLILFFGQHSWKKGLDRLLQTFAHTHRGKLEIVGPDGETLTPRLIRLAREVQIIDRVRILPRVVLGADKEHLYRCATVFVLSSYSENFGNSVLEAMQRAVPVVVTPEVGAAAIAQRSGGGLVVLGNPEAIAAAIDRLTGDQSLARSMGAAEQCHVVANHTWTRPARNR